jgi:predicted CXXCH cytochrome family protein
MSPTPGKKTHHAHAKDNRHGGSGTLKGRKKPASRRHTYHIEWRGIALVCGVVLVLTAASFGYAASKEENNSFCVSCHTQPESTYYGRFQAGTTVDLATFHNTKATKCIDCHSGSGVTGRISAMLLGARNAVAFFTKTARQPAPLTVPIKDDSCLKCHANVTATADFNNHFHAFLSRWQAADPNAAGCAACHTSHTTGGDAQAVFLSQTTTDQVCQSCHAALGGGG